MQFVRSGRVDPGSSDLRSAKKSITIDIFCAKYLKALVLLAYLASGPTSGEPRPITRKARLLDRGPGIHMATAPEFEAFVGGKEAAHPRSVPSNTGRSHRLMDAL